MKGFTGSNPRILVVRLSAIGDCVLTVPMIHALRREYPQAHLAWIVDERSALLLDGLADLDELLVIPRRWHRSLAAVLQIRRALRRRAFDVAIDPQSLTKSGLLSRLSGAKKRIGFAPPVGRELAPFFSNILIEPKTEHLVDRTLELLQPIGVQQTEARFHLPLYAGTEQILDFAHVCMGKTRQFAVVNVGAGWPTKLWCADRFAGVVRHLGVEHGLSSMIVWHSGERELATEVVSKSGGYGHLAPATSLTELATLLRHTRLMVGCDTGPLHLGVAVGTPCVGLYGPTDPARCGPYGAPHRSVQPEGGAPLVGMRRTSENTLMRKIRIDQVTAACDQVLDETNVDDRSAAVGAKLPSMQSQERSGRRIARLGARTNLELRRA